MNKKVLLRCVDIAKDKNNPHTISEWGRYHHFSFLIQGNKILGMGTNKAATSLNYYPRISKIHAEPDVYYNGRTFLNGKRPFDIVNIRLTKNGKMRLSKPCMGCYDFLKKVGCRKVYFSVNEGLEFAVIRLN